MDISEHLSEWLDAKSISSEETDPTKATILDAGVEMESKYGKKPVFNVQIGDRKYKYRPSKTSMKKIAEKYGTETEKWVGQEIEMVAVNMAFSEGMKKVIAVI